MADVESAKMVYHWSRSTLVRDLQGPAYSAELRVTDFCVAAEVVLAPRPAGCLACG